MPAEGITSLKISWVDLRSWSPMASLTSWCRTTRRVQKRSFNGSPSCREMLGPCRKRFLVERAIGFRPTKQPYDPRDTWHVKVALSVWPNNMLAGCTAPDGSFLSGFFDRGSFVEYMAGWGRSVVVGRARLGGIPMGVIAVETRTHVRFTCTV